MLLTDPSTDSPTDIAASRVSFTRLKKIQPRIVNIKPTRSHIRNTRTRDATCSTTDHTCGCVVDDGPAEAEEKGGGDILAIIL